MSHWTMSRRASWTRLRTIFRYLEVRGRGFRMTIILRLDKIQGRRSSWGWRRPSLSFGSQGITNQWILVWTTKRFCLKKKSGTSGTKNPRSKTHSSKTATTIHRLPDSSHRRKIFSLGINRRPAVLPNPTSYQPKLWTAIRYTQTQTRPIVNRNGWNFLMRRIKMCLRNRAPINSTQF